MFLISLEGNIGVGKTTILHKLAAQYKFPILEEPTPDNELMTLYYTNPERYALQTQLTFLVNRIDRISSFIEENRGSDILFIDRSIKGDSAFAKVQLKRRLFTPQEYSLYKNIVNKLTTQNLIPDLSIMILPPNHTEHLNRIKKRNSSYEQNLDYLESYMADLDEANLDTFMDCPYIVNHDVDVSVSQIINLLKRSGFILNDRA